MMKQFFQTIIHHRDAYVKKLKIKHWLHQHRIKKDTILADLSVDVHQSVYLPNFNLIHIPINFGSVKGDFSCYNSQLTSLKGCPKIVTGGFECGKNQLTSLEFCPDKAHN